MIKKWQKKAKKQTVNKQKITIKQASRLVRIGLFLVIGIVVFALVRVVVFTTRLEDVEQAVKIQQTIRQTGYIDLKAKEKFVEAFLKMYVTTTQDKQKEAERLQMLQSFMVVDYKLKQDKIKDYYKTFVRLERVDYHAKNGYETLVYDVTYTVSKLAVEEQINENNEIVHVQKVIAQEKTERLAVDVVEDNGKYNVLHLPYVVSVDTKKGQQKNNVMAFSDWKNEQDTQTVKEVERFLTQFFTKYAQGNVDDLKFMMKEPIAMNGQYTFSKLTDLMIFEKNGMYGIRVNTEFLLKDTDIIHTESFEMELTRQNNNYIVMSIKR